MRALVVSDKVVPHLYSEGVHQVVGRVDLLLSCGDLPPYYLDFLASVLNVPFYFVHGNHPRGALARDAERPPLPPGANLHRRVVHHQGLLLAGLEGSRRYRPHAPFQYTEGEMRFHCLALVPRLLWNRMVHGRYLDVLITHAPPRHIHDAEDPAHQGFVCFRWFMRVFRPRYLIHGHKHVYRHDEQTVTQFVETTVINTYPYTLLDLEPAPQRSLNRQVYERLAPIWQAFSERWETLLRSRATPTEEETTL